MQSIDNLNDTRLLIGLMWNYLMKWITMHVYALTNVYPYDMLMKDVMYLSVCHAWYAVNYMH